MTARECLQILRKIKDVAFATADENGMPHNRIIDVMLVEDEKFYFCTARGKEFYRQLMGTEYTEITGMNREYQMVRLAGKVQKLADQKKWIDRIFEENPSMNEVYPGESRYILEPFCIECGQIEFFDLGKNPIFRETFTIGPAVEEEKGFEITNDCIGCGKCKSDCPQQCISEGTPFVIRQEHCLHCGLCFENCSRRSECGVKGNDQRDVDAAFISGRASASSGDRVCSKAGGAGAADLSSSAGTS